MSEIKNCPFCGGEATIDNAGGKYQAWCKHCCCIHMGEFYNTEAEAIAAWNRRHQPENPRQHALQTGVCPMCEDCPDGCPVETPNDSRNRPENEPLTLDEMNALDHEPIYVLHTGGKWTMNGWHIATASSYQNHGRCDLEIDNGNTIIDMQNYGKTWLAYRRPPEMFIGVDLASGHDFTAYGRPPERSENDA